jgi:hypothetical protein
MDLGQIAECFVEIGAKTSSFSKAEHGIKGKLSDLSKKFQKFSKLGTEAFLGIAGGMSA